ncbi:MAG TPA: hypothetical protein VE093_22635 [Polyangiaceae bacterium]|nr:hypothetical protein [Polyangiaceae bacterium]
MDFFYRITNGLEVPILLLTPLGRFEGEDLRPSRDRVYAYVDPEGVLQLTKRFWPVPDDIDVVFPDVPFATEVASGKVFEERLALPLPIKVDIPYLLDPEEIEKKREEIVGIAEGMVFSIGYLVEEEGPLWQRRLDPTTGAEFTMRYGTVAKHQRILHGGLLDVGVPVRDLRR